MPWPLTDGVILNGFPKPETMTKNAWNAVDVSMITLCKKRPTLETIDNVGWWKYHPIPDGKLNDERVASIWEARDIVLSMIGRSRITVVHCLAGRNRSALVAGLALQYRYNWTGPETLAYLREHRPRSIHNKNFEALLMSLGRPR